MLHPYTIHITQAAYLFTGIIKEDTTMSKKDFKDNPALQFISDDQTQSESAQPKTNKGTYKGKSETLEDRLAEIRAMLPEGQSIEVKTEPRSKRLQLVITPTMQKQLRVRAEQAGISINEYVIRAIEARFESEDE